jgi:hypothetical protein
VLALLRWLFFACFLNPTSAYFLVSQAPTRTILMSTYAPSCSQSEQISDTGNCLIAWEGTPKASFPGSVFCYDLSFLDACCRNLSCSACIGCICHILFDLLSQLASILDPNLEYFVLHCYNGFSSNCPNPKRNLAEGICDTSQVGGNWEHLGGIWEASGTPAGHGAPGGSKP